MNNLATLFIKTETIKILLETLQKKGSKGVELTISTSDKITTTTKMFRHG